ncbi:hypothetical protein EDD29_4761 [Actinocorallia herbida]|uniref:Lipoprotein n=1 Tax=Actinocorallia herbida TaxID=58109 RepID=A0A3N1D265_9ACTN|nr:hypothetical protein [Actinocorallia herbida]ROO87168.1 hypothetical protein EDD29_4761 [Actinocorallia herbida]
MSESMRPARVPRAGFAAAILLLTTASCTVSLPAEPVRPAPGTAEPTASAGASDTPGDILPSASGSDGGSALYLVGAVNYEAPDSALAVTCTVTQNGISMTGTAQAPDTTYTLKIDLVNEAVTVLLRVSAPSGVSSFTATGLDGQEELAVVNAKDKVAGLFGELQGTNGTSGTVKVGGGLVCP